MTNLISTEIETLDNAWDVVVIGAGVAGCAAAAEFARTGLKTLLVEKKAFPRAKVCGACLNGLALSVFERLGLLETVERAGGESLTRFSAMRYGENLRFPIQHGLAVTRERLDPLLARAAVERGATFVEGTTAIVEKMTPGKDFREIRLRSSMTECKVRSQVVVIAAGLGQTAASADGIFETRTKRSSKVGAGCVIDQVPDSYASGEIRMAIGRQGYVGMVRVEAGRLNVAAALFPAFLKASDSPGAAARAIIAEAGFEDLPALASAHWLGTPPLSRRTRPLAADRVFLVGDAAGYVEPFTGEGMGWALASVAAMAPIVRRAAETWSPEHAREWEKAYERTVGRRQGLCRNLASIHHYPMLTGIAFRLAKLAPPLTGLLVRRIDAPSTPLRESVIS